MSSLLTQHITLLPERPLQNPLKLHTASHNVQIPNPNLTTTQHNPLTLIRTPKPSRTQCRRNPTRSRHINSSTQIARTTKTPKPAYGRTHARTPTEPYRANPDPSPPRGSETNSVPEIIPPLTWKGGSAYRVAASGSMNGSP